MDYRRFSLTPGKTALTGSFETPGNYRRFQTPGNYRRSQTPGNYR